LVSVPLVQVEVIRGDLDLGEGQLDAQALNEKKINQLPFRRLLEGDCVVLVGFEDSILLSRTRLSNNEDGAKGEGAKGACDQASNRQRMQDLSSSLQRLSSRTGRLWVQNAFSGDGRSLRDGRSHHVESWFLSKTSRAESQEQGLEAGGYLYTLHLTGSIRAQIT
jgi:hypothetical protein